MVLPDTAAAPSPPLEPSWSRWALPLLILLTLVLYGARITEAQGKYGDAVHHLMNALFMHDALREFPSAAQDPVGFGMRYYAHFPAVNLGYYPPVFPGLAALVMLALGPTAQSAQLTVMGMAVLLACVSFAWFRMHMEKHWAAGASVLLMANPLLVYWGRDIMLEIPATALVTTAVLLFERLLRQPRPTWSTAIPWALVTSLAMWTKQPAIMLVGVFGLSLLWSGRLRAFLKAPGLAAFSIVALSAAGIVAMTYLVGGQNVSQSLGSSASHAVTHFNDRQWTRYLYWLPRIVGGWPTLVAAGLGVVAVLRLRLSGRYTILSWVLGFYLLHSFFRAQEPRYACMWMPPLCALAVLGLRHLAALLPGTAGNARLAAGVGGTILALIATGKMVRASQVTVQGVSTAYERASADLRDNLGPFTCLTYIADFPGRAAVSFRLALEERRLAASVEKHTLLPHQPGRKPPDYEYDFFSLRGSERDIYSFGRILRAEQVLRDWKLRYPSVEAVDAALVEWNVKYILTETARHLETPDDRQVAEVLDAIVTGPTFKLLRSYPVVVQYPSHRLPYRTLQLYERTSPLTYNPGARPPVRPSRVKVQVTRPVPSATPALLPAPDSPAPR